jgi:hypothetical protein
LFDRLRLPEAELGILGGIDIEDVNALAIHLDRVAVDHAGGAAQRARIRRVRQCHDDDCDEQQGKSRSQGRHSFATLMPPGLRLPGVDAIE